MAGGAAHLDSATEPSRSESREAVDVTPVSAGADRSGVFGNEHGEGVAVERLEQMGDVAGVCDVVAGV